jgi:hypothetical protein
MDNHDTVFSIRELPCDGESIPAVIAFSAADYY